MGFLQNLIALPGPETVRNVFFPGLGLSFDLNNVAIIILGRPIYWYGRHYRLRTFFWRCAFVPAGAGALG